ncbi:hypothetical protein EBR57_07200 [bacterium]|nr:hypothetical protein [bacterium]
MYRRQLLAHCSLFAAALLTTTTTLHAAPERDIAFDTIRRMAMGGAATTITYDDSAVMINPAGLARVKGPTIKAPRIGVDIGTDFWDASSKLSELKSANEDNVEIIDSLIGTKGSVRFRLAPLAAITNKGFGLGAFGGTDFHLQINQEGSLDMAGYGDAVGAVGIARDFTFFGTRVDLGVAVKALTRISIYDKISGRQEVHLSESDLTTRINDGTLTDAFSQFGSSGIGMDIGFLTDITLFDTPATIGGAVRNIGTTLTGQQDVGTGNLTHTNTVTTTVPVVSTLGLSITPKLPFVGDLLMAIDYQFAPADDTYNSIRMGVEKKLFFDTVHLRGGINQGYIVGGLGVDLRILHFDFAYYSRELGSKPGDIPDPMYTAQLGFFF